jgi:hypothetical protein
VAALAMLNVCTLGAGLNHLRVRGAAPCNSM